MRILWAKKSAKPEKSLSQYSRFHFPAQPSPPVAGSSNDLPAATRSGSGSPRTLAGQISMPLDAVGVKAGQQRRPISRPMSADEHGALGAGRVENGDGVGDGLGVAVGGRVGRPVRASVPAAVEGDHPVVAREVGDLPLPQARVDDAPRR